MITTFYPRREGPAKTPAPTKAPEQLVVAPEQLVAALPRAQLEALVLGSLRDDTAITTTALIAAVPSPPRVVRRVEAALANADVGLFRFLDDDTIGLLLTEHLPAVARHAFTHRVCKSLRALGKRVPWTALRLAEAATYRTRPDNTLWIVPGADFALIRIFVSKSARSLTALSLTLEKMPNAAADIVRLVRAAPRVTDLELAGKKMTSHVIKPLTNGGPNGQPLSRLTRLTLGHAASGNTDTMNLLRWARRLEHLSVDNSLDAGALTTAFQAWRTAREGGEPLLESLELGMCLSTNLWHLALARHLPGLRALKIRCWHDALCVDLALPTELRSLDVVLLGYANKDEHDDWSRPKQYKNANNPDRVRTILSVCPRATTVSIRWSLTNTEAARMQIARGLPLGDGLDAVPASLTTLTLGGMRIDEDALAPLVARPSALRTLTLRQCLLDAPCALAALRAAGVVVSLVECR